MACLRGTFLKQLLYNRLCSGCQRAKEELQTAHLACGMVWGSLEGDLPKGKFSKQKRRGWPGEQEERKQQASHD